MSLFNKISIGRKPIPPRRGIETVASPRDSSILTSESEAVGHRQTTQIPPKTDHVVANSLSDRETRTIDHSTRHNPCNYETIDASDFERILQISNTPKKTTTESVPSSGSGLSHHVHETSVTRISVVENEALETGSTSPGIISESTVARYGPYYVETSDATIRRQVQESISISGNDNITSHNESKPLQRTLEEKGPLHRLGDQKKKATPQLGAAAIYNPGAQPTFSSIITDDPPYEANPPLNSASLRSPPEIEGNEHLEKSIEQELFDFRKEEASMQLALGDYSLAEINIDTIIHDPRTTEGSQTIYWVLQRAYALQMLGRWQESLSLLAGLNDTIQGNPNYAKQLYMMAEATYQLHQYKEAKTQCSLALHFYEQFRSTDSTVPHDDFRMCIELMARITEAIGVDSTEAKFYRSKVKEGCVSRAHLWQVERDKNSRTLLRRSVDTHREGSPKHNDNHAFKEFVVSSPEIPSTSAQDSTVPAPSSSRQQVFEYLEPTLWPQSGYLESGTKIFGKDQEKAERVKKWLKPFRINYSYEISRDIFDDDYHRFQGSDEDILSAFDLALRDRNTEIVEALMYDQNIQWRRGERSGCTALFYAVMNDNSDVVEALVARGIPVNAVVTKPDHDLDIQGPALPLPIAVKYNKTHAAKALLENNADPNGDVNYLNARRMSPLHNAIWNNNFSMVKLLIQHMASQEVLNHKRLTPLQLAAELGRLRLVELLLDNGAWIGSLYGIIEGAESNTPLHLAAMKGHVEVVKLLLSRDASVHYVNRDNLTPLQLVKRLPWDSSARNPVIIDILTKEAARQ